MKLGQMLVKKKVIDRHQLRAALEKQECEGARLGELLVRMGLVSKRAVLEALQTQPEFVADPVRLDQADRETVRLVPRTTARRLRCLAIERRDDRLIVAMADPLDAKAIDELEEVSGAEIEPRWVDPRDLDRAIQDHFSLEVGTLYEPSERKVDRSDDGVVSVVNPDQGSRVAAEEDRESSDRSARSSGSGSRKKHRQGIIRVV